MFYEEIRRQAEAAPRAALPAVTAALWRAFGEGQVSEAEAEALSGLIEARQASALRRGENAGAAGISAGGSLHARRATSGNPGLRSPDPESSSVGVTHISGPRATIGFSDSAAVRQSAPRSRTGSRPRTDASMARRRRWAASGRLPPGIAARFTLAEQAVLAVLAVEVAKRGDCRLCHEHVAAAAGVSRSSVKAALRQARILGLVTVEERRLARFRNDTNVVRIVSAEWQAWMRLARKDRPDLIGSVARPSLAAGGGVKSATRTSTGSSFSVNSGGRRPPKGIRGAEIEGAGRAAPCSA